MSVLTETIGEILDNYADCIEGGNSYRGSGTAYNGVPSTRSTDENCSTGNNATAGSTTTATIGGISATVAARIVRSDAPPFFLLCTAQASGSGNTGAARKIISHNGTDTFTVAPAFDDAVASGDTFSVVEGFKRMRDISDYEAEDTEDPSAHDRTFSFEILPGKDMQWYGQGYTTYDSQLHLRVRFLKRGRERLARQTVLENIQNFRTILTRQEHRGNFVQLLEVTGTIPDIEVDDKHKVVVLDKYRIVYRLDATFI